MGVDKEEEKMIEDIRARNFMMQKVKAIELRDKTKKAWEITDKIAKMLKNKYNAKEVYLYGSLARGNFRLDSDIDIYVKGFEGNYWEAITEAEKIGENIEISIALEENATERLKYHVNKEGIKFE